MTYIETLFDRYSDVPKTILIKIELLRLGVRYTERVLDTAVKAGAAPQTYYIFSYGVTVTPDLQQRKEERSPETIILKDGTPVQTRLNKNSPYCIDRVDDKFIIYENNQPITDGNLTEVTFLKAPKYYSRLLDDGTPMRKIVSSIPMLFSTLYQNCEFFNEGLECKFCDITPNVRSQVRSGRKMVVRKKAEQVAEVMEIALKEPTHRHYILSGGTILSKYAGMGDVDYYCSLLNTIIGRIGRRWRGTVQTIANSEKDTEKVANTGISSINPNIEVWDPKLFKMICPGKDKFVGRDEWVRRVIKAVDYFIEGGVNSNFVSGVEMAKPWGFKDVNSAVQSTLGGFEYLMVHDVTPRMDVWCIESDSWLGKVPDQEPAPTEYYVRIQQGYYDLMKKYGTYYPIAWCRECCQIDTIFDWKELYPR
jgi:hypothetical protein